MSKGFPAEKKKTVAGTILWVLSNGPAVVTVLGSAALAIAASVVEFKEMQLLQGILALLALVGTSLLTEKLVEGRAVRNSLGGIEGRLEKVLAYAREIETKSLDALIIRRRDLGALEDRLCGATKVKILGGSLFRVMNEYRSLFETLAVEGCGLQFLVTDPQSDAVDYLSSIVVYESRDVETYRAQLRASVEALRDIAKRHSGNCEVRLCKIAPPFSIMIIERGGTGDAIQVELYAFKLPARERPVFLLTRELDPKLFSLFTAQFEAFWAANQFVVPNSEKAKPASLSSA